MNIDLPQCIYDPFGGWKMKCHHKVDGNCTAMTWEEITKEIERLNQAGDDRVCCCYLSNADFIAW